MLRKRLGIVVVAAAALASGLVPLPPLLNFVAPAAADATTPYRDAVLADAPYAYVPLDETSGTTVADATGNGRNATLHGGVILGDTGPLTGQANNRSARFGAVGRYAGFSSALVPSTGNWTAEVWAQSLGDGLNGGSTIWSQYFNNLNTRITAQVCRTTTPRCVGFQVGETDVYAPGKVDDGKWYHLVFRRTGNKLETIVNTKVVLTATTTDANDTKATMIGGHDMGGIYQSWFNGRVAHFAVYRSSLADARVRAHYSAAGRTAPVPAELTFGLAGEGRTTTTTMRNDPVNTATGAFVTEATDMTSPAPGVPFAMTRTYNSNDATVSDLGKGWIYGWATAATIAGNGDVTVRTGDGGRIAYTKQPDGSFTRPASVTSTLSAVTGGFAFAGTDGVTHLFDTAGRLVSLKDRNGQGVTIARDSSNRVATATDAASRVFTFAYNTAGKLASVTAADGRTVSYSYTGDLMTSVTDVRGETTSYRYETGGRIDQVTDANGDLEVRNTYGTNGRVVEQLDPLGKLATFAWDAATQTSTMTDALGKTWVDVYVDNVLISSTEPSGTTSAAFDGDGSAARLVDAC